MQEYSPSPEMLIRLMYAVENLTVELATPPSETELGDGWVAYEPSPSNIESYLEDIQRFARDFGFVPAHWALESHETFVSTVMERLRCVGWPYDVKQAAVTALRRVLWWNRFRPEEFMPAVESERILGLARAARTAAEAALAQVEDLISREKKRLDVKASSAEERRTRVIKRFEVLRRDEPFAKKGTLVGRLVTEFKFGRRTIEDYLKGKK